MIDVEALAVYAEGKKDRLAYIEPLVAINCSRKEFGERIWSTPAPGNRISVLSCFVNPPLRNNLIALDQAAVTYHLAKSRKVADGQTDSTSGTTDPLTVYGYRGAMLGAHRCPKILTQHLPIGKPRNALAEPPEKIRVRRYIVKCLAMTIAIRPKCCQKAFRAALMEKLSGGVPSTRNTIAGAIASRITVILIKRDSDTHVERMLD
ncbi:hypothetical protein UP09_08395 [Bradyrhizobium sp. LTSP885]|nr:hypothetical protein UP09_08395 [Bradyrhizobium sp. LTSP885]